MEVMADIEKQLALLNVQLEKQKADLHTTLGAIQALRWALTLTDEKVKDGDPT